MDDTDSARRDYIAAAFNQAWERAYPPEGAYTAALIAERKAAKEWDRKQAAKGAPQ